MFTYSWLVAVVCVILKNSLLLAATVCICSTHHMNIALHMFMKTFLPPFWNWSGDKLMNVIFQYTINQYIIWVKKNCIQSSHSFLKVLTRVRVSASISLSYYGCTVLSMKQCTTCTQTYPIYEVPCLGVRCAVASLVFPSYWRKWRLGTSTSRYTCIASMKPDFQITNRHNLNSLSSMWYGANSYVVNR